MDVEDSEVDLEVDLEADLEDILVVKTFRLEIKCRNKFYTSCFTEVILMK